MSIAARSARQALYRDFYELIPLFSTFSAVSITRRSPAIKRTSRATRPSCRRLHTDVRSSTDGIAVPSLIKTRPHQQRELPFACPGCGALTQSVHPHEAGHYSKERAAVRKYLHHSEEQGVKEATAEDRVVEDALGNIPPELRAQLGFDQLDHGAAPCARAEPSTPICDRCHHLVHHHSGVPINHPSLSAIEATIAESPHKYNHVYHVIDAADFPLSFVPALTRRLDFAWIRSRNRRAKTQHWSGGKSGEISFLITRSDLLAPKKEQVDQLMPQMREILRDAIGKTGKDVRLGNVHLVSSKRGWWTRQVKTDIWERGGANWLVGKANVGKSNIFEVIYPKGTNETTPDFRGVRDEARRADVQASLAANEQPLIDDNGIGATNFQPTDTAVPRDEETAHDHDFLDTSGLLPPPQQEVNYPVMPIISSLPGTTASPIRIPFGKGKGELIDLPGMTRQTLEPFVKPEHHLSLIMKQRVVPERIVIKPGSSLVLGGGLVRITPRTEDLIFMAHAFVPMDVHLTSTAKAIALQNGERDLNIPSIVDKSAKGAIRQAGAFKLESNVTKKYAGPLTRRSDAGLSAQRLPFVVWATDILIEGCGWVEVVAQVRKPRAQREQEQDWHDDGAFGDHQPREPAKGGLEDAHWSPMSDLTPSGPSTDADASIWTPTSPRPNDPSHSSRIPKERKPATKTSHPLDLPPDVLAKTMPEIEVFSPEGKFIGQRPSLSCWLLGGPTDKKTAGRPRRSMKGMKKAEKRRARGN